MEDYKKAVSRHLELFADQRSRNWTTTWQEIRDYLLPERSRFLEGESTKDVNNGQKKYQYIMDSTPMNAIGNLAAGLKSYLTTPSRPWIRMKTMYPQVNALHPVKVWLDRLAEEMHSVLNRSNFYDALHNTYIEFAGFATGGYFIFEDEMDVIHCEALTIGEYAIACDDKGVVNTIVRRIYMRIREAAERFGRENLSENIRNQLDRDENARVWIYHIICPNDGRLPLNTRKSEPYISIYCENSNASEKPLQIGSYPEFPFIDCRWNVISNDVYGTEAPGQKELSNIKQLYKEIEKKLVGIYKVIEPPLVSNQHSTLINSLPGGVSYATDAYGNGQALTPLYQIKPDIAAIAQDIEQMKETIKAGFFNQLFLMFSTDPGDRKTTYEIARLQEEKMSMLGPMIERLISMLRRAIDRVFAIMVRQGYFDQGAYLEPPPELAGQDLDVEFISLLAQAQKTSGLRSIDSLMQFVGMVAQMSPEILDRVNFDKMTEYYQDGTGTPADCLVPQEVVDQQRAVRAQQQQMMAAIQAGGEMADGAAKLGKTPMNQNTALDAVLKGGRR